MPTVIRTTHDGSKAIVRSDTGYMLFDTKTSQIVDDSVSLVSLLATRNDWTTPETREMDELTPLVASGMSTFKRKKKAEDQPRDGHGRWVSAGANVRWAADGQEWAGTVEKIENGKAIVKVRHKDGSHSMTTLLPNTLRVMASKARLGSAAKKYHDWQNKSDRYIGEHAPELEEAAAEGGALLEREDGYAIEMKEKKPKDQSNPIVYQLYAPNGKSMGIYDGSVVGDIDDMIGDHQAGGPEGGSGEAPAAPAAGVVAAGYNRPYSVPKAVREAVEAALASKVGIPEAFRAKAEALASGDQVGLDEVKFVHGFFSAVAEDENLYGGFAGRKWADKIMEKVEADEPAIFEAVKHDFTSERLEYFAVSKDGASFNDLIGVDFEKDVVYLFDGLEFSVPAGSADTFDAEYIEPLDNFTASVLADMLHEDTMAGNTSSFSTLDLIPEERNLFALAESAMDFDFIGEVAQLSNEDYKKSVNAQGQARGEAGKFGAPNTTQVTGATVSGAPEADAGASVDQASDQAQGAADPMSVAKYFAIVDEVDQTAVLDIVAVTNVGGAPAAFKRTQAAWMADAEYLTKLQGPTPPTIVALDTEDEVKDVLSQIDAYDSGEEAVAASAAQRGFSMPDGSLRILNDGDLVDVVNETSQLSNLPRESMDHIVKRARALNRMDLVPEDWRVLSQLRGPRDLIGEFGEVIVAAGVPGIADTASDHEAVQRLKNYWKYGPGAAKIRWGTEGDLTRAYKNLVKYVGPENAWGLAQNLHMELFGESNYKKDNG